MKFTILTLAGCVVVPAALMAQVAAERPSELDPRLGEPPAMTGGMARATDARMTEAPPKQAEARLSGTLELPLVGLPELETPEGAVFRLYGPLSEGLADLQNADGRELQVTGRLLPAETPRDFYVTAFRLEGDVWTIGHSAEEESIPTLAVSGRIMARRIGEPVLLTPDGQEYRLVGLQIRALMACRDVDGMAVGVEGQFLMDGETAALHVEEIRDLAFAGHISKEPPADRSARRGRLGAGLAGLSFSGDPGSSGPDPQSPRPGSKE